MRLENDQGERAPEFAPSQIDLLVNSLEYRGNDAAGVALVSLSGDIHIYKDHEPAWEVTSQDGYRDFLEKHLNADIVTVLVHTRKATKGTPFKNPNNHPLRKDAGVVVHNGMISNDDRLFTELKLERGCETDSDIIRALLDANSGIDKEVFKGMNKLAGSVASAMCHPSDPTKLLLLRSGNPLVVADDGSTLYFASDKRAIYRAARPWVMRHGMPMQLQAPALAFLTMPNDTGWIIGSRGLEWHDKFNSTSVRYRYANYGDVYSPYGREHKRERHQREAKPTVSTSAPVKVDVKSDEFQIVHYIRCPNKQCDYMMALSPEQQKLPTIRLQCCRCQTNLNGAMKSCNAMPKAAAKPN